MPYRPAVKTEQDLLPLLQRPTPNTAVRRRQFNIKCGATCYAGAKQIANCSVLLYNKAIDKFRRVGAGR